MPERSACGNRISGKFNMEGAFLPTAKAGGIQCAHLMNPTDQKQAVTDAYRLLAKRTHPDKPGGDDEAMKALNILHDAADEAWDLGTVESAADVRPDTNAPRTVAPKGSDASRIAQARVLCMARRRESQASASALGFDTGNNSPAYYKDLGNGSAWLARHILYLAQLINTPASLIDGKYLRSAESFNPVTGMFESETHSVTDMSLAHLTARYRHRISELGISEALLEERSAELHSISEDVAFRNLSFDEKMATFRERV